MSQPEWTAVRVTRRQARLMAEAIWTLQERLKLYAEIAHVKDGTTVKDQLALAEIRRRLYLASWQ